MAQISLPQVSLEENFSKISMKPQSVRWSSIRVGLSMGVVCKLIELLVGQ